MIELRTFGALDLREAGGRELRLVLAQPKRFALLAYLAAATPGPFHRRDTLLPLFWPDLDTTRARAALSRAVHYLRSALGEGVLQSRGDDELGLDPERFRSDVAQFREHCARGRAAEALELYRGDFLEGFYLADTPQLERWIESERQRLRDAAANAARMLSSAAESAGDLAMALHWARQSSAFAPFEEGDVRRVLQLVSQTGDRAAGVEFYDRFARRLRDELDVEPSAETTALRDALAAPPPSAAPQRTSASAPAPAPLLTATGAPPIADALPERRRSRVHLVAMAVLSVIAVGGSLVWGAAFDRGTTERPPALAVLPLANVSADLGNQYFSDGMTDELISTLSQLPGLRVAARTSSFAYKNRNVPVAEIARALHVDAVLEGSARQEGDRIRISLQLVRAPEGFSLWSKTYERERRDVLALQREVSRDVAEALKLRLAPDSLPSRARSTDPETYDLYLWGRYHWNTRTREGLLEAVKYFQRALARDSSFAPAHTGLAESYALLVIYDEPAHEFMPKAKAAALRALELDDASSEAHAVLGYVATWYDWEWESAEPHFRRAVALNPSNATAHHWYSLYLSSIGRAEESMAEMDAARERDPSALLLRGAAGVRLFMTRQYADAVQQFEPALKAASGKIPARPWLALSYVKLGRIQDAIAVLEPQASEPGVLASEQAALAMTYAAAGRREDALAVVRTLEASADREFFARSWLARAWAVLGDRDRALHWLERAYEERDGYLTFAKIDPSFDPLRGEPRFRAVLEKMRLQ